MEEESKKECDGVEMLKLGLSEDIVAFRGAMNLNPSLPVTVLLQKLETRLNSVCRRELTLNQSVKMSNLEKSPRRKRKPNDLNEDVPLEQDLQAIVVDHSTGNCTFVGTGVDTPEDFVDLDIAGEVTCRLNDNDDDEVILVEEKVVDKSKLKLNNDDSDDRKLWDSINQLSKTTQTQEIFPIRANKNKRKENGLQRVKNKTRKVMNESANVELQLTRATVSRFKTDQDNRFVCVICRDVYKRDKSFKNKNTLYNHRSMYHRKDEANISFQ